MEHLRGLHSSSTQLFEGINKLALERVESFKPDIQRYRLNKDFSDLIKSGVDFSQVYFYDLTSNMSVQKPTVINIRSEDALALHTSLVSYNIMLEFAVATVIREVQEITHLDERSYLYSNKVGSELGYCKLHIFSKEDALNGTFANIV